MARTTNHPQHETALGPTAHGPGRSGACAAPDASAGEVINTDVATRSNP